MTPQTVEYGELCPPWKLLEPESESGFYNLPLWEFTSPLSLPFHNFSITTLGDNHVEDLSTNHSGFSVP